MVGPAVPEYVAAWFVNGHGLDPVYRQLDPGDDIAGALIGLLEETPEEPLQTFVPEGSFVSSGEREGSESLQVELGTAFWDQPAGEVYAGAAQIVNTLATLEEGKEVILLDGTIPGEILDGSFEPISQPLSRDSFEELQPWFVVEQPVAGSTVGASVPVRVVVEGNATISALILQGEDNPLGGNRAFTEQTTLELPAGLSGEATLYLRVTTESGAHTTEMPLRVQT